MSVFDSLGLGEVEADPNALPDGKWPGVIFNSRYVEKKDGSVAHVLTYKVTEGNRAGAIRDEWWNLGLDAKRDENGKIIGLGTPTMSEQQKPWYKQRLEALQADLGPEFEPESLIGKKVTFGTKKRGTFINVNFVQLREGPDATAPGVQGTNILGSL